MAIESFSRRRLMLGAGAALALGGCDRVADSKAGQSVLESVETLTLRAQRGAMGAALAPEYAAADISPVFKPNGSTNPEDEDYQALAAQGFAGWRLEVGGLVERPQQLSLSDLRALPFRTQITRHDCVEGWSCIGRWTGARLSAVLDAAGVQPAARYVVFRCADALEATLDGSGIYYESIDMVDARHEQTILAYEMNGMALPIAHGAPLRLRVERQLGYKQAKYIMKIELVDSFADIGRGRGSFWADRGYEWYAGI